MIIEKIKMNENVFSNYYFVTYLNIQNSFFIGDSFSGVVS